MKRTIFCTIATARGLPRAFLLGDSIRELHGEVDFRILVVEHPSVVARIRTQCPQRAIVGPDEIGCPQWLHMAFFYQEAEFAGALQPAFVGALQKEGDVVYFDPDVEVHAPLDGILEKLRDADVVLLAQSAAGAPNRGWAGGPFNLGFLAVRGGADGREAAPLGASAAGMADPDPWSQPLGPALLAAEVVASCQRLHVLRPPHHGLAHWNVGQHPIRLDAQGRLQAEGGPVVFCHYAGLRSIAGGYRSRYPEDEAAVAPGSPFHQIVHAYELRLGSSPHRHLAQQAYSLGFYTDGTPILQEHRRAFLRLSAANRRRITNPFAERETMEQLWAHSPEQTERMVGDHLRLVEARLLAVPFRIFAVTSAAARLLAPQTHARVFHMVNGVANGYQRLQRLLKST